MRIARISRPPAELLLWPTAALLLALLAGWYIATTWTYLQLAPAFANNPAHRALDKQVQYLLLGSLGLVPLALLRLQPWLKSLIRHPGISWTLAATAFTAYFAVYGAISLLSSVGFLYLYAFARPRWKLHWAAWFKWVWISGVVLAALFYFQRTHLFFIIDLYEDGPRLAAVNETLRGGLPYRDFFIHYGIIQDVLRPLLAFQIWGTNYYADQMMRSWLSALGGAALIALLFATLRRLWLASVVTIVLALRPDFFVPDRLWASLLAITVMAIGLRTPGKRAGWLFAGGVLSTMSVFNSLEVGVTLMAGIGLWAVIAGIGGQRQNLKPIVMPWLNGCTAALVVIVLYLTVTGSLTGFVDSIGSLATQRLPTWADGQRSHFFSAFWHDPWKAIETHVYLHAVPLVCGAVVSYVLITSRAQGLTAPAWQALLIGCVALANYVIYVSRSDFIHWKNSTIFYWPLLAYGVDEALSRGTEKTNLKPTPSALILGFAALVTGVAGSTLIGRGTLLSLISPTVPSYPVLPSFETRDRLGPLPPEAGEVEWIQRTASAIQSAVPSEGWFFNFTLYSGFYFLADRRNPTRYGLPNYIHGERMIRTCLSELDQRPPHAILVQIENDRMIYRDDLKPIAEYLQLHYKPNHTVGRVAIWVPRATAR